jgi:hypothetical protein
MSCSFSPIAPLDESMEENLGPCERSQNVQSAHTENLMVINSVNGPSECDFVQRAMTPVIGSSQNDAPLLLGRKTNASAQANLLSSPNTALENNSSLSRHQSMYTKYNPKNLSPLDSQFSRQFSAIDMESVASSAVSSASTRNQIEKCIEVLQKALNLKKLVSLK